MPASYGVRLEAIVRHGFAQLVRPPSHSLRAAAARIAAKRALLLLTLAAVGVVALMYWLDASEITWMPARGTAALWPLRIATDFGKFSYIFAALAVLLVAIVSLAPRIVGVAHATLLGFAARLQYIVVAVVLGEAIGQIIKGTVGRGRPFVGGEPHAFTFSHFNWTEAYASFPSGHATASCALAFAVGALWPRLRLAMVLYVVVIMTTRLVLLAHHPSDVVGGAFVGVISAMLARYWFAARRVVFIIRSDGSIAARTGPTWAAIAHALRRAAGF